MQTQPSPSAPPGAAPEGSASERPPLRRARPDSADMSAPILAGVCSGLAVHLGTPVKRVRLAFLLGLLAFGSSALLYLWLWATVPAESPSDVTRPAGKGGRIRAALSRRGPDRGAQTAASQLVLAGGATLLVVALVLAGQLLWHWDWTIVLPIVAIVGGLAVTWTAVPNRTQWPTPRLVATIALGLLLVVAGALVLLSRHYKLGALLAGAAAGAIVVVAATVALIPLAVSLFSDLSASRLREVRETERADIAAHLHDSVLQTLTLIRGAAADPVRVRALALTQERELRAWLYTGHEDPGGSTAALLRARVAEAEATYGVEVSFVAVGDTTPGPGELAACAAAAEAITNALRHGAPPIAVYMEARPDCVEIFVKDSGAGFDVDAIPEDRHGVRDSIQGRMVRVGGSANIRTNPQTGTEVHLQVPVSAANQRPQPEGPEE